MAFMACSVRADLFVGTIKSGMNTVLQYDESAGNFLADFGAEIPGSPRGLVWAGGILYVASDSQKAIFTYDSSGNFIGSFAQTPVGGLNGPRGIIFDTAGNLYVACKNSNKVEQYDPSGNYLGDFVPAGNSPLSGPRGLVFDAKGNLYVASFNTGQVLQYDSSGNYLGGFTQGDNGALASGINGL